MAPHVLRGCPVVLRHLLLRKCSTSVKASTASVPELIKSHRDGRISQIIDVRTPAEFQKDHIPGAINLPVLANDERVTVGTLYSSNQFEARKTGAATISRNIANHIDTYFQTQPADYKPLIYCWRGGQRSYSMALVLAQIGFETFVLEKGYKKYRDTVREELATLPAQFEYRVISGLTGSGKTKILQALRSQGHQIIDIEGIAKHKGSVLGLWHGETQPSQKYFESLICDRLHMLTTSKPVWVESESMRVGNVLIPDLLLKKIKSSPKFSIHLPIEERVKHIIKDYPNWIEHNEELKLAIQKLVRVNGHDRVNSWLTLIDEGHWEEFVRRILLEHYDPTYTRSQKNPIAVNQDVHIDNLEENTVLKLVHQLASS